MIAFYPLSSVKIRAKIMLEETRRIIVTAFDLMIIALKTTKNFQNIEVRWAPLSTLSSADRAQFSILVLFSFILYLAFTNAFG